MVTGDAPLNRRQMLRGSLGVLLAGTLPSCALPACAQSGGQPPSSPRHPKGCEQDWACVTDERFSGGARGDGTTDDTAAINSAIRQAGGGTVYLPKGEYLVHPISAGGVAILLDSPATSTGYLSLIPPIDPVLVG
jgi:hypothetical protein